MIFRETGAPSISPDWVMIKFFRLRVAGLQIPKSGGGWTAARIPSPSRPETAAVWSDPMTQLRTAAPVLVLIDRAGAEDRFLLEWHANWRTFMFPVTRPREFRDDDWGLATDEQPVEAAARAAAEAAGVCLRAGELHALPEMTMTNVSQSQGKVTNYRFQVFRCRLDAATPLQPGGAIQWLTLHEIADPDVMPISPVARAAARMLLERQLDR